MTDIRGVLRDVNDESSLISHIALSEVQGLIDSGVISGGMIPKIQSSLYGVEHGVKQASIIDGRVEHALLKELASDTGIGTVFDNGGN